MNDPVNNPSHYTSHPSGVEAIEITRHMGYNLGNVMKYIWRADLKNEAIQDLEKARFYLSDEIAKLKLSDEIAKLKQVESTQPKRRIWISDEEKAQGGWHPGDSLADGVWTEEDEQRRRIRKSKAAGPGIQIDGNAADKLRHTEDWIVRNWRDDAGL